MSTQIVFGARFRKARLEAGLSQQEVADGVGVTRALISRWERGKASPMLERLDQISATLNKPAAYFFTSIGSDRQHGVGLVELCELMEQAYYDTCYLWEQAQRSAQGLGLMSEMLYHVLWIQRNESGVAISQLADEENEAANLISERVALERGLGEAAARLARFLSGQQTHRDREAAPARMHIDPLRAFKCLASDDPTEWGVSILDEDKENEQEREE